VKGVLLLAAVAAVGVPLLGIAFALFQLAWWRWMANTGRRRPEDTPWFGVLWRRGMVAAVATLVALALCSRFA
jgi:hypothetical protein